MIRLLTTNGSQPKKCKMIQQSFTYPLHRMRKVDRSGMVCERSREYSANDAPLQPIPNRMYKDRLFRMIFKDKEQFLELYNAINDTDYQNPNDLTVTTLENAIYMGMHNDVSYVLYDHLTLYEHQSTHNPNMPLRNLFYVSDIYSDLTKDDNLLGSSLVAIPSPQFIVFYNGMSKLPERFEMRLSDAYERKGNVKLELVVDVFNINAGYNQELLEKCRVLWEYMKYVDKVRTYKKTLPLQQAVELSVQECINEGILADFLSKNRAEVIKVSIYEYDEEKHMQQERNDMRRITTQENIIFFLEDVGKVPEELKRIIYRIRDLEVLNLLLKKSARATDLTEFEEEIRKII